MSGIYIHGMEMPKSCPCELIGIGYDLCCSFAGGIPARLKEYYECCQNDTRPFWCPLIPVPDHGRLIDESMIPWCVDWYVGRKRYYTTPKTVEHLPTVIPADKDDKE